MRIAIFSDIHGNSIALDAVLHDIRTRGGADAFWVLGDLVALGPDPLGVLERVYALPNITIIRGNTDRFVASAERPPPSSVQVAQNPALVTQFGEMMSSFAWTLGVLSFTDWLDKLAALLLEQRIVLENRTRVLCVHAAPGTDDGEGIYPRLDAEALSTLIQDANADLILVGHTHWAMDVMSDTTRVVNPGSVSNPFPPDLRAKYTFLESDANGYHFEHRRVEYDHEAVVEQLRRVHHPASRYIVQFMRGEHRPPWSKNLSQAQATHYGLPLEWVDE